MPPSPLLPCVGFIPWARYTLRRKGAPGHPKGCFGLLHIWHPLGCLEAPYDRVLREAPYHGVLRGTPGVLLEAPFHGVLWGTLGVLCEAPCHRVPRGTLRVPNMKQSEAPFRVPRGTLGVLRSQGHRVRSQGA